MSSWRKNAVRQLNGTDNHQHNAFDYSNTFTFFDVQKQILLETKQHPFRIINLNTFQYCAFAWRTNSHFVLNTALIEKAL